MKRCVPSASLIYISYPSRIPNINASTLLSTRPTAAVLQLALSQGGCALVRSLHLAGKFEVYNPKYDRIFVIQSYTNTTQCLGYK